MTNNLSSFSCHSKEAEMLHRENYFEFLSNETEHEYTNIFPFRFYTKRSSLWCTIKIIVSIIMFRFIR